MVLIAPSFYWQKEEKIRAKRQAPKSAGREKRIIQDICVFNPVNKKISKQSAGRKNESKLMLEKEKVCLVCAQR